MRVLLTTIGSRGDVEPLLALALALRGRGHDTRLCAPPDFGELAAEHAVEFVPLGESVRAGSTTRGAGARGPSLEALRRLVPDSVAAQFTALRAAARGCAAVVVGNQIVVAGRSVAEEVGVPYVFADYNPVMLPSRRHAPPPLPGDQPAEPGADPLPRWAADAQRRNATWAEPLNAHRVAAGLSPVTDVRGHVLTDHPLLAADPVLAPWPTPSDLDVVQTGAWIVPDRRPLSTDLEAFLAAGDRPFYFGFGSMREPEQTARAALASARGLGARAVVLRGWSDAGEPDLGPDCIAIGETNLGALLPRVAVAVHHGGAGTTTTATRAGVPQVVVPHHYDQHYFAARVESLGVGVAHPAAQPTPESLTAALRAALRAPVALRARDVGRLVRDDGADIAAGRIERLVAEHAQRP